MSEQKKKVSSNTHTKAQLDHYANQNNRNNRAYHSNQNNHANQCNPNNREYLNSRNQKNEKW